MEGRRRESSAAGFSDGYRRGMGKKDWDTAALASVFADRLQNLDEEDGTEDDEEEDDYDISTAASLAAFSNKLASRAGTGGYPSSTVQNVFNVGDGNVPPLPQWQNPRQPMHRNVPG